MNRRLSLGTVATTVEVGIICVLPCVAMAIGAAWSWVTGEEEREGW